MHNKKPKIFHVFKFLAMGVLFLTALGFGVRELWNCLIPDLFNGPVVSFWQALGLCLLGKLLFGWHGGGGGNKFGRAMDWRRKMQEKMEHMTPEERDKVREKLRRCMHGSPFDRWTNKTEQKDNPTTTETNI